MEAQSSAGVSGNSATEVEVIIYDGTAVLGTVIAVDGQWTFGVPAALSLGNHGFQAQCAQAQSAPWSLNVVAPFRDFTDFENQNWGGWVPGPVGNRLVFNPIPEYPGHYVLFNATYDNNSAGVVVQKTLSGMHVGMRYRFEVGAGQIITPGKVLAKLSLSSSAGQVTDVFTPPYGSIIFRGEFVANSTTVTVSIVSHEAPGNGNDYYFSHFLVNSV